MGAVLLPAITGLAGAGAGGLISGGMGALAGGLGGAAIGAGLAASRSQYQQQTAQANQLRDAQLQANQQAAMQMNNLQAQNAAQMAGLQRQAMQMMDQQQAGYMAQAAALKGLQGQYSNAANATLGPSYLAALGAIGAYPGVNTSPLGDNSKPNLARNKLLGN